MTVYELIQELSRYNADTQVDFHFEGSFDTDVVAKFDRENDSDEQEVTTTVDFEDDVYFDDIDDHETDKGRKCIQINLTY